MPRQWQKNSLWTRLGARGPPVTACEKLAPVMGGIKVR